MSARAILLAAGLLAALFIPALADTVTATVNGWDATTRTMQIDDKSFFQEIPASVKLPDIEVGDEATIEYEGGESDHSGVTDVALVKKKAPAV